MEINFVFSIKKFILQFLRFVVVLKYRELCIKKNVIWISINNLCCF